MPRANILFSSDAPGLPGTTVDGRRDLAIRNSSFPEFSFTARLGKRHKVRFQYIPIGYDGVTALSADVAFNGRIYRRGDRVTTTVDWTAYRVGYEYDFLRRRRWWLGVLGEVKQTDIRAGLSSSAFTESRRTRVPVPALGPVGRVYLGRRFSITGEVTGMAVPDSADRHYGGHYIDTDIFGSMTVTPHFDVQVGFRSLDLRHLGESDAAKIKLTGAYAGVAVRVGARE